MEDDYGDGLADLDNEERVANGTLILQNVSSRLPHA